MFVVLRYWNCSGDRGPQIISSRAACVASPALWHFKKTRTLFVGINWKEPRKFGRDSWFGSGPAWNTRRSEYVVHSVEMWPHAKYIIICSVLQFLIIVAVLFPHYASPYHISKCSSLLSIPYHPFCSNGPLRTLSRPGQCKDYEMSSRGILQTSTESWWN